METIELGKNEFLKVLEIGGTFAGKTKALPILECVKIKVCPSFILVTSGDNENWISKKLEMETGCENEFSFCVNFKDLYSYVKLINSDMVTLCVEDKILTIKHKKGHTSMPVEDSEMYPQISAKDDYALIVVPSYIINNWIVDAKPFVKENELRPIFGSLYFYCKDGEFGCCASDTGILYWNHDELNSADFDFTLNKNSFDAVCKLCTECEKVEIEIGNSKVKFRGGDTNVLALRVEGRFPNFKAIIPNNQIKVKVNRKELIDAVNRCRLSVSSLTSPTAKISVDSFGMVICCQNIDFSKSSQEAINAETNGNIEIGMDCNLLIELLKTINTDNVIISFSESCKPMIMKEDCDSNKLLMQMPMQLN